MSITEFRVRLKAALKACAIHLSLSVLIATAVWLLVVRRWYPYPLDELAGGLVLLALVFGVDVVCGPLLTLVAYNPAKKRRLMLLDFTVIGSIQLAALAYGLYSVTEARPVVLAFEVDRFVAVPAAGVDLTRLKSAPANLQALSWRGPVLIGTRKPKDAAEQMNAMTVLLQQGLEISARPDWWQSYELSRPDVKTRMKHLANLYAARRLDEQTLIETARLKSGLPMSSLYYLPMTGQKREDFIAILDAEANIVGYANVSGFDIK